MRPWLSVVRFLIYIYFCISCMHKVNSFMSFWNYYRRRRRRICVSCWSVIAICSDTHEDAASTKRKSCWMVSCKSHFSAWFSDFVMWLWGSEMDFVQSVWGHDGKAQLNASNLGNTYLLILFFFFSFIGRIARAQQRPSIHTFGRPLFYSHGGQRRTCVSLAEIIRDGFYDTLQRWCVANPSTCSSVVLCRND